MDAEDAYAKARVSLLDRITSARRDAGIVDK
jgi:hypothetical protein